MKQQVKYSWLSYLVVVCFALQIWAFFQFNYSYTFYYKEQNQLFLLTSDYVMSYFSRPAWAACLVGDFLTQLFFYMYAGAAVFALLVLALGASTCFTMKKLGYNRWVALLLTVGVMGYVASCNFDPQYLMSSMLCLQGGVLMALIYTMVSGLSPFSRSVSLFVLGVLALWMFNWGVVVFLLMVLTGEAISAYLSRKVRRVSGPLIVAVMLIAVYLKSDIFYPVNPDTCRTYPGLGKPIMPRSDLEDYLEADNLYYFGRYDELIEKVSKMDNPSREVSFFYYLVKARRGELPYSINSVKPVNLGTLYNIGPESSTVEIKMVAELYFALGDMTMAEREALLSCVFSRDNRNVRMIKRLAEANLVAGDDEAAMKYLRILDNTLAYSRWSKANRPGHFSPRLRSMQQYMVKDDTIRVSTNCRDILTTLLKANPRNRMALDYLLCTDYLVGARDMFVDDMQQYYIPYYGNPVVPMYRELYKAKDRK